MWGEHGKATAVNMVPHFLVMSFSKNCEKLRRLLILITRDESANLYPCRCSATLVSVVDDAKRGSYDRQIPVDVRDAFVPAMSCNGNGLCFNYDATSPMCPSSKVTRDRRHSPKGRAGMMREWLSATKALMWLI